MNELLLVVRIAGQRVALPAGRIESVVELDTLIPAPRGRAYRRPVSAAQPCADGDLLPPLAWPVEA
jgi:purine-binding chemotaxis protein CheW